MERRMAELESKLAQEVAIRQVLAAGANPSAASRSALPAGYPETAPIVRPEIAATSLSEPDWRTEMEKKDRQIAYLRSVVEKMAFQMPAQTPPVYGSPQMTLETTPGPQPASAGLVGIPSAPTNASVKIPVQQILGEVTQASPENNFVFINRGDRHGVVPGMKFEVYRKGVLIARVQIGTVYDTVSSVFVIEGSEVIQTGDMVRSA